MVFSCFFGMAFSGRDLKRAAATAAKNMPVACFSARGLKSLPLRQQKALAKASAFCNDINPHQWIYDMPFGRDIHLRRMICLRAWVDLYHIIFGENRIYHNLRKQIISYLLKARYIMKNTWPEVFSCVLTKILMSWLFLPR